ncbi:hypothetical protein [Microbacterium sp. JZ31]|uniref:hypothetical protein n=1 Tax=Microbacterium sp. JZ31 TaxID=1906274 RepID=UPI001932FB1C|nr:hypothetical protein [Microbacterium sp. JZ31]
MPIGNSTTYSALRWTLAAVGLVLLLALTVTLFTGLPGYPIFVVGNVILATGTMVLLAFLFGSACWTAWLVLSVVHLVAGTPSLSSRRHPVIRALGLSAGAIPAAAVWCVAAVTALVANLFPSTFTIAPQESAAGCRVVFGAVSGAWSSHGRVYLAPPGSFTLVTTDVRWRDGDGNFFDLPSEGRWNVEWRDDDALIQLRAATGDQGFRATRASAICATPEV